MENFNERFEVISLLDCFSTKAATSRHKIEVRAGEKIAVLCELGGASAIGATFLSAAATGMAAFSVLEATAASAAGSAVSGATMSLGISTANVVSGGCQVAIIQPTSALTTSHEFTICGSTFHCTAAGPGRDGEDVSATVTYYINHHATLSRKVYAVDSGAATALVEIWPKAGCTGITMQTGDASAVMGARKFAGVINIDVSKLSTNRPKFLGVAMATYAAATAVRSVKVIKSSPYAPNFCGKVVDL